MRIFFALAALMVGACGGHGDPAATSGSGSGHPAAIAAPVDAGSGSGSGSAAPVAMGSDGLPVACAEWREALDKLGTCDAVPANARDSLKAVYTDVSKGWGQLPIDAKRRLGPICQAGADSVLKGAKATCGW